MVVQSLAITNSSTIKRHFLTQIKPNDINNKFKSSSLMNRKLTYKRLQKRSNSTLMRSINEGKVVLGGGYNGNNNGGNIKGNGGDGNGGYNWNNSNTTNPLFKLAESDEMEKKPYDKITLTLCSFTVTRVAISKITRNFRKEYKEKTGRDVKFRLSFSGSGVQARAVIDGLPADIVALALPLDIQKIQQAGLINKDWRKRVKNDAVFAESVVAIVVRKGNPKNIMDWPDLIKDQVEVVTANPKTAGVARWNFLALWGYAMKKGEKKAKEFVTKVFEHVPIQPRDAREASDVFYKQAVADALLTYENEVLLTNLMVGQNEALPYIVPKNNIRIDSVVSIIDKNMNEKPPEFREAAEAFVDYLFTADAQREFVKCGFRSVIPEIKKESSGLFPKVNSLMTVEKSFGGWLEAQKKFFDANQVLDDIQKYVAKQRLQKYKYGNV